MITRSIFLILFTSAMSAGAQSVIVNPDGTHSTVHGNVIVNPNGTHSTIHGNIIVNPNGTHSTIHKSGNNSLIVNPNGTHSIVHGNFPDGTNTAVQQNNPNNGNSAQNIQGANQEGVSDSSFWLGTGSIFDGWIWKREKKEKRPRKKK